MVCLGCHPRPYLWPECPDPTSTADLVLLMRTNLFILRWIAKSAPESQVDMVLSMVEFTDKAYSELFCWNSTVGL